MNASTHKKEDIFISVVVLTSDLSDDTHLDFLSEANEFLSTRFADHEIVIVGNWTQAIPKERLAKALARIPSVRYLTLAYEVGTEIAFTVGMENAIGDYVCLFNPRQDPLSVLDKMYASAGNGVHVVVGVATNARRSIAYRLVRPFVSLLLRSIGYTMPKNSTTLRCVSRAAIQSSTKGRNYHHRLYMKIAQCGLRTAAVDYDVLPKGRTKRGLFGAAREILGLLVFNSTAPLRVMSVIGFAGSFFAFVFATYSFLVRLLRDNVAEGWSSLVVFMSFLFMLLFVMLSFFGEYLARLLNEQSRHEPYWVVDEMNSSVMLDMDRANVTEHSHDLATGHTI